MTLKLADWFQQVEEDDFPSLSSGLDKTTETVDLTQPMEGDDCFTYLEIRMIGPKPARGDLEDPSVLDPHI